MFRSSMGRLRSLLGPTQRKLFLLVFLWTCLCLVVFKNTLFAPSPVANSARHHHHHQLDARSAAGAIQNADQLAAAATAALEGPEFALPDNGNSNALYYGLAATASSLKWRVAGQAHKLAPIDNTNHNKLKQPNRDAAADHDEHRSAGGASREQNDELPPLPPTSDYQSHHVKHQHQQQQQATTRGNVEQQEAAIVRRTHTTNSEPIIAGSQCKYNYPNLFDLQFNNIHWQKLTTTTTATTTATPTSAPRPTKAATYYLYNAYYDNRWRGGPPSVRVLAMIDRIKPPPTNCLLWSSKLRHQPGAWPLVARAHFVYAWYPAWGNYKDGLLQPWIVTCNLPRAHKHLVPDSVTLAQVPPEINQVMISNDADNQLLAPASVGRNGKPIHWESQQASIAMPPTYSSPSSLAPTAAPAAAASSSSSSLSPDDNQQQQARASSSLPIVSASSSSPTASAATTSDGQLWSASTNPMPEVQYDCKQTLPLTNNLPVFNKRPAIKQKFAVCVKGLDFPHDDVSVRLVEWIEMLNLLGASKIFLYELDVHENISKVLRYYQKRGLVELSPLTLPGDQPNLPEYQHLYLKNRLTAKRQNELIPYNDCLYRNLNSYQYLALLDIDEIIMPLQHHNWFDLMQEVEKMSLGEQNYSRASYNVRNVYFFDDLSGPLGTTSSSSSSSSSLITDATEQSGWSQASASSSNKTHEQPLGDDEPAAIAEDENEEDSKQANGSSGNSNSHESAERGIPHYLHMMSHVYRSKNYTEPGQYVKCFHNTERVVSLHNHFPMNCFGQCTTYSIPVSLAHLQHYRKDCVGPLKQSCKNDFRVFTTRDTTIWKYKQRMIRRATRVLNHLDLLSGANRSPALINKKPASLINR